MGSRPKLTERIIAAVQNEIDGIEEVIDYGLMAQNNESSALSIGLIETHADRVVLRAAQEKPSSKVTKEEHLLNADFYAITFVEQDTALYAVHKTDASWQTRKKNGLIAFFFDEHELIDDDKPSFNISKSFDFFIIDEQILIKSKSHFESVLNYKTAFQSEFKALQEEDKFRGAFVNLEELIKFVGKNKIQLRRVAAIREKGYYKNGPFMENRRVNYSDAGLNIIFDENGKIVPTQETCRDIFQALLDFRLTSMFSHNIYDVPDTASIA